MRFDDGAVLHDAELSEMFVPFESGEAGDGGGNNSSDSEMHGCANDDSEQALEERGGWVHV